MRNMHMGEEEISLYSGNLEAILRRKKRHFLVDTNVFFSSPSGIGIIEDELIRQIAILQVRNRRYERIKAAYDVLAKHDNWMTTLEVYQEVMSQLGEAESGSKKRVQRLIAADMINYLKKNKDRILVHKDTYLIRGLYQISEQIHASFEWLNREKNLDLMPLSKADISLLLACLTNIVCSKERYQKMDIIACDYGITLGAEAMFAALPNMDSLGTPKLRRTAEYRNMRVISMRYDNPYETTFDSTDYCIRRRNGAAKSQGLG